jgi:hypothetical protein
MPARAIRALVEQGYQVTAASGGAVAVAPLLPGVCAGLRLATGPTGVSRRGRIGVLVAREAGLLVRGADDEPFPAELDVPAPVLRVAAEEGDLASLGEAIRHIRV